MSDLAKRLGRAYLALARRLGLLLGVLAAAAGSSVVVVLPFWYLATRHRTVFNAAVILLCVLGLGAVAARRLGRGTRGLRAALQPALLRLGGAAAWLGLLYVALLAFASARPLLGVAVVAALLLAAGLMTR